MSFGIKTEKVTNDNKLFKTGKYYAPFVIDLIEVEARQYNPDTDNVSITDICVLGHIEHSRGCPHIFIDVNSPLFFNATTNNERPILAKLPNGNKARKEIYDEWVKNNYMFRNLKLFVEVDVTKYSPNATNPNEYSVYEWNSISYIDSTSMLPGNRVWLEIEQPGSGDVLYKPIVEGGSNKKLNNARSRKNKSQRRVAKHTIF
jgi:hypothetical protein